MSAAEISLEHAIRQRRSVRGYLPDRVPEAVLQNIFELAQLAPSNCNVQPWKVYVASGALRDRLSTEMQRRIREGVTPNPDYDYRGDFLGEYRTRQVECAVALYNEMGIERHDKPGRERAILRNFEFFDAPYMAFIGMDKAFGTTVAIDVGMYAQNLMLLLVAHGLHSCPICGTIRIWCAKRLTWEKKIVSSLVSPSVTKTLPSRPTKPAPPAIRYRPALCSGDV